MRSLPPEPASAKRSGGSLFPRCLALMFLMVSTLGMISQQVRAADAATGTIEGRVLNLGTGRYLSKALVQVQGTTIEALTNDYGEYTLNDVPVGTVKLTVSYTGQLSKDQSVVVEAGKTVTQDVGLTQANAVADDGTIILDQYVVEQQRYKNAQEIATNEERRSVTLKNVVAADAFGSVTKGNVGEFVKFLPGVQVSYGGTYTNPSDISYIGVRGFGPDNTALLVDGHTVSNPSPASLSRAVGVDMLTMNNASRVEVIKTATPDMPSNSAGGVINLITKSAFEYAKPEVTLDAHMNFNTMDTTTIFKKQQGPGSDPTYHNIPGFALSYILPISKTLGVTFNASIEKNYTPGQTYQSKWQQSSLSFGGAPVQNSLGVANPANPWLNSIAVTDQPWNTTGRALSSKLDWKPTPGQLVQLSVGASDYKGIDVSRKIAYNIKTATNWGSDFVTSANYPTGATSDPGENVSMQSISRDKLGNSTYAYLNYSLDKGDWHFDASAGWSVSYGVFEDMKNGHFSEVDTKYVAGQILFSGIQDGMPSSIVVKDRNGNVVDTTDLSLWKMDSFSAQSGQTYSRDTERSYTANLSRNFIFNSFDFTLKTGFSRETSKQEKWGRGTGYKMTYVGPSITNPTIFLESGYNRSPGFGWAPQQWASTYAVYDLYRVHPEYFNPNDIGVSPGNWTSYVNQQKAVLETRDAYYAMFEAKFFNNRLSLVGGGRKQSTTDKGRQPFNDGKWNFLKYANGTLYTDAALITASNPLGTIRFDQASSPLFTNFSSTVTAAAVYARAAAAGVKYLPAAPVLDALTKQMLINIPNYEVNAKKSDPVTPMLAASYKITENLVFKPAWSRTTTLPNYENTGALGNNTGGLISTNYKITQNDPIGTGLGGDGTIAVANPNLRAEKTDKWDFTLAYYTHNGGSISASYFYAKTKNKTISEDIFAGMSDYNDVLAGLGLDPAEYVNWKVTTQHNSTESVLSTGYEFSMIQNMGILGAFGQHFDTFLTYSHKNTEQPKKDGVVSFPDSSNDQWAAGIRSGFGRFSASARATWLSQFKSKSGTIAYAGQSFTTYKVTPQILKLDLSVDYQITKWLSVYISSSNVLNTETIEKTVDAGGVEPTYSLRTKLSKFGTIVSTGIKGRF